jgi:hypothetical protein
VPPLASFGRRAGVLAIALALVAVGGTALRSTRDSDGTAVDPVSVGEGTASVLRVVDEPGVEADGDRVVVAASLANVGVRPVLVRTVRGLPPGVEALLPAGGLKVAAGGRAPLRLRWLGPDCAARVPEQVLADIDVELVVDGAVRGSAAAAPTAATLDTAALDRTFRDAWRATCDDTPDDIPEDATAGPSGAPPPQDPAPSAPATG